MPSPELIIYPARRVRTMDPARPVADVMAAFAAGSISSAGRPSTTTAARQASAPGRSWLRSFGDGTVSVCDQPGKWASR